MLHRHFVLVDQKKVFPINHYLLFLHLEYSIFYCLFFDHHFRTLYQKVYLLLESLAQLNDLSFYFLLIILVLLDIYSNLIVLLKPDFNCDKVLEICLCYCKCRNLICNTCVNYNSLLTSPK